MAQFFLIIAWLKGKKTYLLMAIAILTAITGVIDGSLSMAEFIQAIFTALGMITMRAGIAKLN